MKNQVQVLERELTAREENILNVVKGITKALMVVFAGGLLLAIYNLFVYGIVNI